MAESIRVKRVSSLIKEKFGAILSSEISDPGMGMVTVTDVKMSKDLKIADIYFSIIGGSKDLEKQVNIVKNKTKHMRHRLSGKIVLKYMPRIRMHYDDTPVKAQKLEKLFQKINLGNSNEA